MRNGHWSKVIRGQTYYFGKDYVEAVEEYEDQKLWLEAGVEPPEDLEGVTVADLLNAFLSEKQDAVERNRLSERTYDDYEDVCDRILEVLPRETALISLKAGHFILVRDKLSEGKNQDISLKSLNRKLGYARTIFKFASTDNRLIDRNLPFQDSLKSVSKLNLRREKASRPRRGLTEADIQAVLKFATPKVQRDADIA